MAKSNKMEDLGSDQVGFGENLIIHINRRLPQFDNGEALAYEVQNVRNKLKTFVAIISGTENLPRWTSVASYKSMSDVSFLRFIDAGAVFWTPDNVEKFVIIYDRDVGTPLVEEGKFGVTSWRHPDIVSLFIEPMARMLKEMRDKGFAHGSIRPSNIFCFPDDTNRPIVLGDGLSVQAGSTQLSLFLPVNKALCDPMGRGFGSQADDIYAFGVSLYLFLRKNNELSSLDDEEILRRKVEFGSYSTFLKKERFQATFLELLRGVLYDDEAKRWGVEEIFAWMDGVRITPLTLTKKKKANRPFNFNGKKYFFAELLAVDLHHNPDAFVAMMERGSLDRWVRKALDDDVLVERYEKALEYVASFGDISKNKDYSVFHMSLALNPVLPTRYKGLCFTYDGLGGMLAKDAYEKKDLEIFKEIINLNILDYTLSVESLIQTMMLPILKQYDSCRADIVGKKIQQGMERCIYTLCPNAPCLSLKTRGYYVYNPQSVLLTFEDLCTKGGQVSLMMDRHLLAFFSARDPGFMNSYLLDFNHSDKDRKISGNLHFMAALQKQSKIPALPAIAGVFVESLAGSFKVYKHAGTRKRVQDEVKKAAKAGDLIAMSCLIDDSNVLLQDENGFKIATNEYRLLQREYNQYNSKLANKKTYGITNGHDAAAMVSWLVSTVITAIVVLAFLSGHRMF